MKLSGHKAAASLWHYDPSNTVEKKSAVASALLLQKRPAAVALDTNEIVDTTENVDDDKENELVVMPKKIAKFTETGGVQKSADPMMILFGREQELRKNDQDLRKSDQAMVQTAMAHIIEINQKLMNKKTV